MRAGHSEYSTDLNLCIKIANTTHKHTLIQSHRIACERECRIYRMVHFILKTFRTKVLPHTNRRQFNRICGNHTYTRCMCSTVQNRPVGHTNTRTKRARNREKEGCHRRMKKKNRLSPAFNKFVSQIRN